LAPLKVDLRRRAADVALALRAGHTAGGRLVVLTYHAVSDHADDHPDQLAVPRELFARQMAWLARLGWPVVPLRDGVAALRRGALAGPVVALTFDDGYASVYTNAFPVLAEHGFPATVFLVPGAMSGAVPRDFMPARLGGLMRWRDAREMLAHGISIGSHGLTHRKLSRLAPDEVTAEVRDSTRAIEDALSVPVREFCYPYGSFDAFTPVVEQIVAGFGFDAVCANVAGHNRRPEDARRLRRLRVSWTDDSEREMRKQCLGAYNWYATYERARLAALGLWRVAGAARW
jgi:peptidoglycan/xylan/chitin deacetylase (PgdA/CDA1 family)